MDFKTRYANRLRATDPRQFQELDSVADAFLQEATKSGMFAYIDKDLRINQPQSVVKSVTRADAAMTEAARPPLRSRERA